MKVYVVTDGDWEFSTCLGVFKSKEDADKKAKEYYAEHEQGQIEEAYNLNVDVFEMEVQ